MDTTDITPLILNLGTKCKKVISFMTHFLYTQRKNLQCPLNTRVGGPRLGLYAWEKRKLCWFQRESNSGTSSPQHSHYDMIWYDIFVNCNWVVTWWHQYSAHLHTNNTWNNTNNNRTTQTTSNLKECGPCPVFASFTLAFAFQLRKKHGKTSVRVRKTVRLRKTDRTLNEHLTLKYVLYLCLHV